MVIKPPTLTSSRNGESVAIDDAVFLESVGFASPKVSSSPSQQTAFSFTKKELNLILGSALAGFVLCYLIRRF